MLIYNVDDFIKTLPSEMPTATKKQTVFNIMNTVKLEKEDCINDAARRLDCLMEYGDSSISMLNNIIRNANAEIEDHKLKIQELEKLCQDRSAEIDAINAAYNAEKNKIEELLNFLGTDDTTEDSK
jgi:peptidoglycan hydrolase CwlO-like protein